MRVSVWCLQLQVHATFLRFACAFIFGPTSSRTRNGAKSKRTISQTPMTHVGRPPPCSQREAAPAGGRGGGNADAGSAAPWVDHSRGSSSSPPPASTSISEGEAAPAGGGTPTPTRRRLGSTIAADHPARLRRRARRARTPPPRCWSAAAWRAGGRGMNGGNVTQR